MKTPTSTPRQASALAAKVAAVNMAHEYANELRPILLAAFAPYVGQKILKTDGTLLQKVRETLPELPSHAGLSVFRRSESYSLVYTVKTCVSYGEHSCTYHEVSLYLYRFDGVTLAPWNGCQWENLRTDHTEAEVFALRQANTAAKEAASRAAAALYPFGEWDR